MHVRVDVRNLDTLRNFMSKKNFQLYSVMLYALVLIVLAFLVYQVGNLEARTSAVEYRQQLQNNFDVSNIRRGALRTMNESVPVSDK
jgi:hypothetical protein